MRLIGLAVALALSLHGPLAAEAQPSEKANRIWNSNRGLRAQIMVPLRQALSELGDVEGQ